MYSNWFYLQYTEIYLPKKLGFLKLFDKILTQDILVYFQNTKKYPYFPNFYL